MLGVSNVAGTSKPLTPWPVTQLIDPFEGLRHPTLVVLSDSIARQIVSATVQLLLNIPGLRILPQTHSHSPSSHTS